MTRSVEIAERTPHNADKVTAYKWEMLDSPGDLMWIPKAALRVDPAYQRDALENRITRITKAWSWVACGVIEVSRRGEEYWVIDGQHRVLAAMRRSDIQTLPCIVFEVAGVKEEAQGFLNANTTVKPITAMARAKAMAVAGDPAAELVQAMMNQVGLHPLAGGQAAGGVRCMAWCLKRAKENPDLFCTIIAIVGEMCLASNLPVAETLMGGLWLSNPRIDGGVGNARFVERVRQIGAVRLLDVCRRAELLAGQRNANVWSRAILEEVNKGLRNKFTVKGGE